MDNMRRFLFLLLLAALALGAVAQDHTDWSRGAVLYEVNVRQYTHAGTFRAFSRHLDRLEDLGVDILWFMPIHPIGEVNRKGTLGSYYAVKDYLEVNPEFGTLQDFRNVVNDAHARGMRVIMDWVINHSAPDNPLARDHPTWYVRDGSGNFTPPAGTDWTDVIQFNHASLDLLGWMQDALRFWVEDVGVDGFRFDAASLVPNSFWVPLLSHLNGVRPDLLLLAESDGRRYHDAGFDMSFAWDLYGFGHGVFADVAAGRKGANDLWDYLVADRNRYPGEDYRLYFTSNHDENSWIGTDRELFGEARHALWVLAATMNDMALIYSGQEIDHDRRLAFFEKDGIVWVDDSPATELFRTLNQLKEAESALWSGTAGGDPVCISVSDPVHVLAFMRANPGSKVAVVANLSPEARSVDVSQGPANGVWVDAMTGEVMTIPSTNPWVLSGWQARVLVDATATDVESDAALPGQGVRVDVYPNPSPGGTVLHVAAGSEKPVQWEVLDVLGRRMAGGSGEPLIRLDDRDWAAGVYVYRVRAGRDVVSGTFVRR